MRLAFLRTLTCTVIGLGLSACAHLSSDQDAAQAACAQPLRTQEGDYTGTAQGDACAWRGIPFASSGPEFRFRRPGPAPQFTGVRAAADNGPACLSLVNTFVELGNTAEDCLNLNVWAPQRHAAKLPVMVFLYGGGFALGSGSWSVYDGANLAHKGVIVVTLNYRLNALGFYGGPAQKSTETDGAMGNWGIWDQIAALRWVRANIGAFGGDSENVTLFGESSGGFSVCTLLAAQPARGLFHRAIIQSGSCFVNTAEETQRFGAAWLSKTPCADAADKMACLRTADAGELDHLLPTWSGASPTVDGVLLTEQPIEAIRGGRAAQVPLLVGANRTELSMLQVVPNIGWAAASSVSSLWSRIAKNGSEEQAAKMAAAYPTAANTRGRDLWQQMIDDIAFRCSVVWSAEAQSQFTPTYAYEFDIGTPVTWAQRVLGGYHFAEGPYVFGNLGWNRVMNEGPQEHDESYSRRLQAYWLAFTRTGNPNDSGGAPWPMFKDGRTVVRLEPTHNIAIRNFQSSQCAYWRAEQWNSFPTQVNALFDVMRLTGVPFLSLIAPE